MAAKNAPQNQTRKPSKREKRIKMVIYIMIAAMILSTLTAGLAMFV
ncbi:stressosome-associated protein Prli42 [Sediminibacillus massiliensis]|nr:stressosome-associated protein Prli42 [Sediminibacillus massiliensis]